MKVDNIIDGIMIHGRGTLLAKFDVESAYRIIPVYSHDCYLLGIKSQGKYFIDLALTFGLRSAPFMFSSFADHLEWILKHNYDSIMNYITWMISIPWALLTVLFANKTWISVFFTFQRVVFPSTLISLRALPCVWLS